MQKYLSYAEINAFFIFEVMGRVVETGDLWLVSYTSCQNLQN
jgi:hypothetical protein